MAAVLVTLERGTMDTWYAVQLAAIPMRKRGFPDTSHLPRVLEWASLCELRERRKAAKSGLQVVADPFVLPVPAANAAVPANAVQQPQQPQNPQQPQQAGNASGDTISNPQPRKRGRPRKGESAMRAALPVRRSSRQHGEAAPVQTSGVTAPAVATAAAPLLPVAAAQTAPSNAAVAVQPAVTTAVAPPLPHPAPVPIVAPQLPQAESAPVPAVTEAHKTATSLSAPVIDPVVPAQDAAHSMPPSVPIRPTPSPSQSPQ